MPKESLNLGYNEIMELKIKILNIKKGLSKMKKYFPFVYTTNFGRISEPTSDMNELGEMPNFLWRQ